MFDCNRKLSNASIYAVIAASIVAWASPTLAVQVGQHGLGQVLLYPYYTVRAVPNSGAYNTMFILTNTSPDTKVVRVRFRESKNGRPVASMNVYLVPNDSWAGGVVPTADLAGAELHWNDQSCTDPAPGGPDYVLPFSNAAYSGANSDLEDPSLARTTEGYIEAFELGVVKDPAVIAALKLERTDWGVIPECSAALAVALDSPAKIAAPTGGLMGSAFLINVFASTLYSYDATALDDFSRVALWSRPTTSSPTLEDVNPKLSRILDRAVLRENSWEIARGARPADPVSAVLMQDQLLNFFVLDPGTASATDWIVTMPTKPHYVNVAGTYAPPPSPFASSFNNGGAPDSFEFDYLGCAYGSPIGNTVAFDREGYHPQPPVSCPGVPPPHNPFALAWTANLVTFPSAGVFASNSNVIFKMFDTRVSRQNGWARLAPFPNAVASPDHKLVSTDSPPVTFYGLPMIGFMANSYYNGAVPDPAGHGLLFSAYGATSPHRGKPRIQ